MRRRIVFVFLVIAAALVFSQPVYCQETTPAASVPEVTVALPAVSPQSDADAAKQKIIDAATEAVKAAGFTIQDVNIVYDEDGKLWGEKIGYVEMNQNPNQGVLVRGFMKNYKIVYFDYKEPIKDVWVFIDKDTGEVLEVYQEQ